MLKLKDKDFTDYAKHLDSSNTKFIVDKKRAVKSLIIGGKFFALSKNKNHHAKKDEKREMLNLFSQVAKCVTKYILKNNFDVKKIIQRHPTSDTDRIKYASMEVGDEFFYIDIAHCFWRIAFLRGYITEKLYKDVLGKPNLKTFRNMALACIVACRSREYHDKGKLLFEVSEDRSIHQIIYNNIRFTSYNLMGDIRREISKHFIAYRTDGMMVTKPAVKKVQEFFTNSGLGFTVKTCFKVDDKHYSIDGKVKKI